MEIIDRITEKHLKPLPTAKPRFSVIMPVYNAAHFFAEVLDSIPNHLDEDFEILLIDDCSTDGTSDLIRRHSLASKIQLLKTPKNSGPAAARNLGAAHARGEFLLFFDADVIFYPDTFERVRSYVHAHPDTRCFTGINAMESAGKGLASTFHARYSFYALNLIPEGAVASTWNPRLGFIRKDLFDAIGGFDTNYRKADVEDYEFSKKISQIVPIGFTRALEVKHRFGNFRENSFNFFKRSRQWTRLFFRQKSLDKTGHTRTSQLPNIIIPFLLTLVLPLGFFFPITKIVIILLGTYLLFNLSESMFFIRTSGVLLGVIFTFFILYYYWVAVFGIILGLADLMQSFIKRTFQYLCRLAPPLRGRSFTQLARKRKSRPKRPLEI